MYRYTRKISFYMPIHTHLITVSLERHFVFFRLGCFNNNNISFLLYYIVKKEYMVSLCTQIVNQTVY